MFFKNISQIKIFLQILLAWQMLELIFLMLVPNHCYQA